MAWNLLIYLLYLHSIRRLSWSATTLATLIVTFTAHFSAKFPGEHSWKCTSSQVCKFFAPLLLLKYLSRSPSSLFVKKVPTVLSTRFLLVSEFHVKHSNWITTFFRYGHLLCPPMVSNMVTLQVSKIFLKYLSISFPFKFVCKKQWLRCLVLDSRLPQGVRQPRLLSGFEK